MKAICNTGCEKEFEVEMQTESFGRDPDNITGGQKFILDGLVRGGVIPDDSQKYIAGIIHRFRVDKRKPRVEVEIIGVNNAKRG